MRRHTLALLLAAALASASCSGDACDPASFTPACDGDGLRTCELRHAYGVQSYELVHASCDPGNVCVASIGAGCVRDPPTRCDPAAFVPREEQGRTIVCAQPSPWVAETYEIAQP